MPNISFDIFFDNDVLNFTAARSQGIPKVKPGWKVRTAPKLPPKEKPEAIQAKANRPPSKPVQKPTIQPKSAPPAVKPPRQTIKASPPKPAEGAAKTNGVNGAAAKPAKKA